MSAGQIRAVLAACDRGCAAGRRDYAIVLMMARLALRGGEVARLLLSDIDWRAAEVSIRGKGARIDVLPLAADVGEAMADYLLHARPTSTSRHVFVTMVAPFTGLATSSITAMVGRACARAGVSRFGPHGLRHAVARELHRLVLGWHQHPSPPAGAVHIPWTLIYRGDVLVPAGRLGNCTRRAKNRRSPGQHDPGASS